MRLDVAMAEWGLARSRSHARQLIDAGQVSITGVARVKPSTEVDSESDIVAIGDPYVSRAAHKLLGALDDSGVQVPGRVLDAGASTGGFTQVLLERGATRVYAVDVGHDQMATSLREDPRVTVREGLNLRDLTVGDLDGCSVDLVVGDVSFISLTVVMDRLFSVLSEFGQALLLVKPQFEVGKAGLDDHGVVVDEQRRLDAVDAVIHHARSLRWELAWRGDSSVMGEHGNREVFCLFTRSLDGPTVKGDQIPKMSDQASTVAL